MGAILVCRGVKELGPRPSCAALGAVAPLPIYVESRKSLANPAMHLPPAVQLEFAQTTFAMFAALIAIFTWVRVSENTIGPASGLRPPLAIFPIPFEQFLSVGVVVGVILRSVREELADLAEFLSLDRRLELAEAGRFRAVLLWQTGAALEFASLLHGCSFARIVMLLSRFGGLDSAALPGTRRTARRTSSAISPHGFRASSPQKRPERRL